MRCNNCYSTWSWKDEFLPPFQRATHTCPDCKWVSKRPWHLCLALTPLCTFPAAHLPQQVWRWWAHVPFILLLVSLGMTRDIREVSARRLAEGRKPIRDLTMPPLQEALGRAPAWVFGSMTLIIGLIAAIELALL